MSIDPSRLRDEALRLPATARAKLADELLRSLDAVDEETDLDQEEHAKAWGLEISERLREIDAGEVQPVSWSDARRRISSKD